ncbi:MAG: diguanylate phosphodiesterase [Ilumatobacteraceae bacterium]|nr:diguanylate phosphodiesterase [Ilumatobacteraceae bacterium]
MMQDELAAAIGAAVDPTTLMQRVADRTVELVPAAEGVAIGLRTGDVITYVCGAGVNRTPVGTRVQSGTSLSGLAAVTGQVQRSHDARSDPRVDAAACRALSVVSLVCVPLTRSGESYGVVAVNASSPHAFTDEDVEMLQQLADFVSVAIGSAHDLHSATNQLLELCQPTIDADGTASRYMMGVLDPVAADRIEARAGIQHLLGDPHLLDIVVQPIWDLATDSVIAVEALSRFRTDPALAPDRWFHAAHQAGLGVELETLAITRALSLLPLLPADVAITINVGPETIVSSPLHDALSAVEPDRIVIELTEHTAFDRCPELPDELMRLRRRGVRLAVDDAGSGYSSLTHILQLAPDFIKLDRELIAGVDADPVRRALVTSLVSFARDTGAQIVAEGIETIGELGLLRRLGAHHAQGYLLGRPSPLTSSATPLVSRSAAAALARSGSPRAWTVNAPTMPQPARSRPRTAGTV